MLGSRRTQRGTLYLICPMQRNGLPHLPLWVSIPCPYQRALGARNVSAVSWGRIAAQAVVDGAAETAFRDRRNGDRVAGCVQFV